MQRPQRDEIDMFWECVDDVKPCPFCGKDNLTINRRNGKYGLFYFIKCGICGGVGGTGATTSEAYNKWQIREDE